MKPGFVPTAILLFATMSTPVPTAKINPNKFTILQVDAKNALILTTSHFLFARCVASL